MKNLQERSRRFCQRRIYKKLVLKEYWKAIVDRCTKLKLRNQVAKIKKFQGQNFDRIFENTKNELIYEAILDQEEQYLDHLAKYKM